jgi:hypothetical protein
MVMMMARTTPKTVPMKEGSMLPRWQPLPPLIRRRVSSSCTSCRSLCSFCTSSSRTLSTTIIRDYQINKKIISWNFIMLHEIHIIWYKIRWVSIMIRLSPSPCWQIISSNGQLLSWEWTIRIHNMDSCLIFNRIHMR